MDRVAWYREQQTVESWKRILQMPVKCRRQGFLQIFKPTETSHLPDVARSFEISLRERTLAPLIPPSHQHSEFSILSLSHIKDSCCMNQALHLSRSCPE